MMEENLLETDTRAGLREKIWMESKKIWSIAFPAVLYRLSSYGLLVVTQAFIGHISEIDLAAYALVQVISTQFGNGILIGMSSATETLCGQAFGARQYHMLGIYLQRSWIINVATATMLLPIFIFATPIYILLGQDEDIAKAAGKISLWFIPVFYQNAFNFTIFAYLQAQLRNIIIAWLALGSFVLHVLLSWTFVSKLKMGTSGALASLVVSSWVWVFGQFVYIFGGWCPDTWTGLSMAAFFDLWPVVKLSLSAGIMLCLELWYQSILILIAGYLKNAEIAIASFSICINIITWEFMICLGIMAAAIVRVTNELGRGDAKAAKFSIKVVLSISTCIGVFFWILCLVFGRSIAYLFTSNEEVAETISGLSVFLAFSILLNSVQPILSGIAIGCGRQGMVAYVNTATYYIIGLPIGLLLGYVAHLDIKGIWIGMMCGVASQTLVLSFITWRTDWDKQVNKATEHLKRWFLNPSKSSTQTSNHD